MSLVANRLKVIKASPTLAVSAKAAKLKAEGKDVIAMGACTIGGGPYFKHGYHVVKGVDLVVPVDVYIPGCPPRPEALLEGIMRIQDKIRARKLSKNGVEIPPVPHRAGRVALPPSLTQA